MPTPNQIEKQINELTRYLVEKSLADAQCFAFQRSIRGGFVEVTFQNAEHASIALKNLPYKEVYEHLIQRDAYNVKMLDGALIQMMYSFAGSTLKRHRLAFFSAPHLEDFQRDPDIYLYDEIYANVVGKNIVPFPVRFDYDDRSDNRQDLVHPKSHLSLGQYEYCRIPVTAPMTPFWFIDFILRNFYHIASERYADGLPTHAKGGSFDESISPTEQGIVHMVVPA